MRILPIIGTALAALLLIFVGAAGTFWYTKQASSAVAPALEAGPVAEEPEPTAAQTRTGADQIDLGTLRELLALVDPARRDAILESADVFGRFIEQERANQAVLTAAYANSADRNEGVETLMLRASQKVLAEAYLTQVVRRNLDQGFPDDAQTLEFYEANLESFKLPDRVHVWQVFIPAPEDASKQAKNNAKALSEQVASGLSKGKMTFSEAAERYSKHLQSRVNDGYMGLLKTQDLLPAVRASISELKIDAISKPVRSKAGYHILKRGESVAGQQLEFEAVRERAVAQLRREAAARVRQAAVKKILETYPVAVDAASIPQWQGDLQAVDWP